ncbi:MAG: hypothetical protein IJO63_05395 [Bacilli bacterium]|nr:hypothetical protein [Bacilli bacterium]
MKDILDKYSDSAMFRINSDNMRKIIAFLNEQGCDFIEDIIEDYLDIFLIDYELFVKKIHVLNSKYDNSFLTKASEDMNLLELMY